MAAVDIEECGVRLHARRIGIIGAGAAGLAAARVFAEENATSNNDTPPFVITVLERNNAVGGVWRYTPNSVCHYNVPQPDSSALRQKFDERCPETGGFPTPIYDELSTNLPTDVMQFPDVPFPASTDEFPSHTEVLKYIEAYAQSKVLTHPIDLRLNTQVSNVEFHPQRSLWTCDVRDLISEHNQTLEFDAVLVCTGRVSHPYIPDVSGINELALSRPGLVIHAKEYRRASEFQDQTVLVVGGAASATDIARQLSYTACQVHTSTADASQADADARDPRMTPEMGAGCNPSRPLCRHLRIKEFTQTHVHFVDGTSIPMPDTIIYATGYICTFPFISQVEPVKGAPKPDHQLLSDGDIDGIPNLYKFLVLAYNPLLAILGVPNKVVPFPMYEYQATYLAHLYQRHIQLPPFDQMLDHARSDLEGPRPFTMGFKQVAYMNDLIDCVGDHQSRLGHVPDHWVKSRLHCVEQRKQRLGY
ncbi:monooxygenase [Coemansia sp. RSA 451]|nr:monooxygenase [Coemansia sp. RSA 451]